MVAWLKSHSLVTTTTNGDILLWSYVPRDSNSNKSLIHSYKFKLEKKEFNLKPVVDLSIGLHDDYLWATSSNREICCERISTSECLANYRCASTNISVMRECPDDMHK